MALFVTNTSTNKNRRYSPVYSFIRNSFIRVSQPYLISIFRKGFLNFSKDFVQPPLICPSVRPSTDTSPTPLP